MHGIAQKKLHAICIKTKVVSNIHTKCLRSHAMFSRNRIKKMRHQNHLSWFVVSEFTQSGEEFVETSNGYVP